MSAQKEARARARQRAAEIYESGWEHAHAIPGEGNSYAFMAGYLKSALEQELYRQELAGGRPQ